VRHLLCQCPSTRVPVAVPHPLRSPRLETACTSGLQGSRPTPARCGATPHPAHHVWRMCHTTVPSSSQLVVWFQHIASPVLTMTSSLPHLRVRQHDPGAVAEDCMCEGPPWLRWSHHAARPGAAALHSETRVVRGVAAVKWAVPRPPQARHHRVPAGTAVGASHAVWRPSARGARPKASLAPRAAPGRSRVASRIRAPA
jgi:hypothetical protein